MKTTPLFAALLVLATPACVISDFAEYDSGYSQSYTGYSSTPVYRGYNSTPYYGSVRPAYYGGGYGGGYSSSGYGRGYDYGRYDREDCDDHNDHRHYSSNDRKKSDSSSRDIRITDYNQSRKRRDLPSGYHPPEWWKARGYSLEQNTYKTRDGDVKGKKSSSKKKNKD